MRLNNCLTNNWLTYIHTHQHTYTCVTVISSATAELKIQYFVMGFPLSQREAQALGPGGYKILRLWMDY